MFHQKLPKLNSPTVSEPTPCTNPRPFTHPGNMTSGLWRRSYLSYQLAAFWLMLSSFWIWASAPSAFYSGMGIPVGSRTLSPPCAHNLVVLSQTGKCPRSRCPSRINLRDSNPVRGGTFMETSTAKHISSSVRSEM